LKNNIEVVNNVRNALINPNDLSSEYFEKHLKNFKLPVIEKETFKYDFHQKIYNNVLKPYDKIAQWSKSITMIFAFYSPGHIDKLRKYHAIFSHALSIVNTQLTDDLPDHDLQLQLINSLFSDTLRLMFEDISWHKEAVKLCLDTSGRYSSLTLSDGEDSCLAVSSRSEGEGIIHNALEAKLTQAIARAENAESSCDKANKIIENSKRKEEERDIKMEEMQATLNILMKHHYAKENQSTQNLQQTAPERSYQNPQSDLQVASFFSGSETENENKSDNNECDP
jgi:hypothetical protein